MQQHLHLMTENWCVRRTVCTNEMASGNKERTTLQQQYRQSHCEKLTTYTNHTREHRLDTFQVQFSDFSNTGNMIAFLAVFFGYHHVFFLIRRSVALLNFKYVCCSSDTTIEREKTIRRFHQIRFLLSNACAECQSTLAAYDNFTSH